MSLYQNKYRIETVRRPGWDYARPGYYYVTINTHQRYHFFGEIAPLLNDYDINGNNVVVETHRHASLQQHVIYPHNDSIPIAFRGYKKHIVLNPIGRVVAMEWLKTPSIRDYVRLDAWVIMPDHMHGIVVIEKNVTVETRSLASLPVTNNRTHKNKFGPQRHNLGSIIRGFKSACTKQIRGNLDSSFGWQPRFHDHIIRNQRELNRIRRYIRINPDQWNDKNGVG